MAKEEFTFQAEVGKLLDIVARSLYSNKEIFLRELISNSSDACDRLRYAALTDPGLSEAAEEFKVTLMANTKGRTLSVSDNGIGMSRDDLVENLGTIARSGTQAFVEQLSGDEKKDVALIGQFGVGFYSTFMVAKKVEVLTRKAGEEEAWLWTSDGAGSFAIAEAKRGGPGTTVTLHLAKGENEFLDDARLRTIVKTYSDHVAIPIALVGEDKEEKLNTAAALWTRPKGEITKDQYKEFYRHVAHSFDEPWMTLHNRVEGVVAYSSLLFIPSTPPFDLFDPGRKQQVKLYVKRVFIADDYEGLLPSYLRFLRGIVDSEDLPLNISRETLQHDPRLAKIRAGLVKRVLGELKKKAEKKPEEYAAFWGNFGAVLKEGIYEDFESRDPVLALSRFRSTHGDALVGLDAYVERMKEGQDAIYYITGDDVEQLAKSPQLEGFRARGVEVLLLTDAIDEFWVPAVGSFQDKPFKSATRGDIDLGGIKPGETDEKAEEEEKDDGKDAFDPLIVALKTALGTQVKDVRLSERLTDSPVCLVAGEDAPDMRIERLLKMHRQMGSESLSPRILEINPKHALVKRLAELAGDGGEAMDDAAHLLLDQARIVEGEAIPDPAAFSRRLASIMEKGLMA